MSRIHRHWWSYRLKLWFFVQLVFSVEISSSLFNDYIHWIIFKNYVYMVFFLIFLKLYLLLRAFGFHFPNFIKKENNAKFPFVGTCWCCISTFDLPLLSVLYHMHFQDQHQWYSYRMGIWDDNGFIDLVRIMYISLFHSVFSQSWITFIQINISQVSSYSRLERYLLSSDERQTRDVECILSFKKTYVV